MTEEAKKKPDAEDDDTPAPPRRHRHPEKFVVQDGEVEVTDADGKVVKRAGKDGGKKSADEPAPPDDPHA